MAMLPAIEDRRAFRALDTKPIPSEVLLRLVEAARTAPSAMNNQPWRFITVTEAKQLATLKETLSPGNYWAKKAPALVAVVTNNQWGMTLGERHYAPFELGMATMAYQIQAVAEGLHVHPIAGFNADEAKKVLAIPAEETLMILLVLGYPGDTTGLNEKHLASETSLRIRLPIERIHAFDSWNDTIKPEPKMA
ncbi:MAG: nitroreductase family protein [Sphaerochaeta sp.]|uniref:nitroreductase family protein n=1 Tax=Sphaerochaeta sp. TaxID=1972642 RepID=UPI003D0C6918